VRQLIEHGFRTILTARDNEQGRAAADELGAEFGRLDVADDASVERCFQTVEERHGRLDVLVNNAGIDYDTWQRGVDADLTVVQQGFETNLFGAWRCCRRAVPLMERNAWGRIVNVSSEGGSLASMSGGTPAYSTSKAALNALTRILAAELRGSGILVNAVCPGWIATDMGGPGGRPVEVGSCESPVGRPPRRQRADGRVLPRWEAASLVSCVEQGCCVLTSRTHLPTAVFAHHPAQPL
jgi:NAD(P)-dependent dehydrogenase (short-subunit alcohol dehydrogenase family)